MSTTVDGEREQLLTAYDVAEALMVSVSSVYYWIRTGRLPHIETPGREYRIRKSTLDKWLQERPNPG